MPKTTRNWRYYLSNSVNDALGYALDKLLQYDNQQSRPATAEEQQNSEQIQVATAAVKGETRWQCVRTLTGYTSAVKSVAMSPAGQLLASGSENNRIKLWDLGTGQLLRTLIGHSDRANSMVIAPLIYGIWIPEN